MANKNWPGGPSSNFNSICERLNLKDFKQDREFTGVIGNDVRDSNIGNQVYKHLEQVCPELLQPGLIKKFITNDVIGNPKVYKINNLTTSSGTLILMNHLANILSHFPINNINSVIEIGSGYGGQCKIIKDFKDISYTCIDIHGPLNLCKKYLSHFNIDCNFIDADSEINKMQSDLLISNFCLNELDEIAVDKYFNQIVQHCKYLYISAGNFNENLPRGKNLISKCKKYFDIQIHLESPKITGHPNIFIIGKNKIKSK